MQVASHADNILRELMIILMTLYARGNFNKIMTMTKNDKKEKNDKNNENDKAINNNINKNMFISHIMNDLSWLP